MKKKLKATLWAACLLAGTAHASELRLLTHLQGAEYAWLSKMARQYSAVKGHPQVKLVLTSFEAMRIKLLEPVAGDQIDLVGPLPHDQLGGLVETGAIAPLGKLAVLPDDTLKVAGRAVTLQGQIYGIPIAAEAIAVLYNKALMPKFPKTYTEFLETAQRLTTGGNYGYVANLGDVYQQYGMISAFGGYIFGETQGRLEVNDLGIAKPGTAQALALLGDLRFKYKLVPDQLDGGAIRKLFLGGKAAMFLTGPWDMGDIKKARIDFGIAPFPVPPGAVNPWSPFVGIQTLVVSQKSQLKGEAVAFAQFLARPENQVAFNNAGGRIPVSKKAINLLSGNPVVTGFSKSITVGTPMPNVPQMSEVWEPLNNALSKATAQPNQDYAKLLLEAQAQIEKKLK